MSLDKETPITLTFSLETWQELQFLIIEGLGHLEDKSCTCLSAEAAAESFNVNLEEQVCLKERQSFGRR